MIMIKSNVGEEIVNNDKQMIDWLQEEDNTKNLTSKVKKSVLKKALSEVNKYELYIYISIHV